MICLSSPPMIMVHGVTLVDHAPDISTEHPGMIVCDGIVVGVRTRQNRSHLACTSYRGGTCFVVSRAF